ncbi:MAG: hypothetical protein PVH25_06800 [Burkholderiales bacterium]
MKKVAMYLLTTIVSVWAMSAFAHPGHGVTPPSTVMHYLAEPLHVLQAFAPLALLAATVWLLRRKRIRDK